MSGSSKVGTAVPCRPKSRRGTRRGSRSYHVWRRWIAPEQLELWTARLQAAAGQAWTLTGQAGRARLLAAVHGQSRAAALALQRRLGGRVQAVKADTAVAQKPSAPLRIGGTFEIVSENAPRARKDSPPRLRIPHGMAFGSGEHATTAMLLRVLARRPLRGCRVLDLGTGSGILALAARLLGASIIEGTDFDPDAIRTARQNEKLNFRTPLVRWRRGDVLRRRSKVGARHDVVLANLYSGILVEAAEIIAGEVAPGGCLWLSGILRQQEREVVAEYRRQGLVLVRTARRGKWVVLQWSKKIS